MDFEILERQRKGKERLATHRLGELTHSDAVGLANRPAVPPRERYHESPETEHRTPPSSSPGRAQREPVSPPVIQRLRKIERQYRTIRTGLVAVLVAVGFMAVEQFSMDEVNAGKALIKSEELKLVDSQGRTRVSLRMFSEVPVMQMLDTEGNQRLSFGLRFDDTPFIDLSDSSGMTRATLQITGGGEPALHLLDGEGVSTFSIN